MDRMVGSLAKARWQETRPGIREKKLILGTKSIRLVELSDELRHTEWCLKGHTGYVLSGELLMNIDGVECRLEKSDIFDFENGLDIHRHIPIIPAGGAAVLLLVEDS